MCVWLLLPTLIVSIASMGRGRDGARWLKFLPACIYGVGTLALHFHFRGAGLLSFAPPGVVVAGVIACVGALLFSGKRGMTISGSVLCCTIAATFF